jgi:hypothetical protein
MSQRTVHGIEPYRVELAHRLPIVGDMMLSRLAYQGWIELWSENHLTEKGLTEAGWKAMWWPC